MVNFPAETGQIIPATSGIIGTCRRTGTLLCLNSKVITPNSHDLSILHHHVSQFFSNQKTYFLWSACPSLVPACVSQRRTASLDPRLLSAHSLGGPKGVKDMRLPIPTDPGLSWMIPSYKWPTNGGWKPPFKDWILVGLNLNDWSWRFLWTVYRMKNVKQMDSLATIDSFISSKLSAIKLSHMLIVLVNYTISSTSRFVVVLSHLISFTVIGATCVRSCT